MYTLTAVAEAENYMNSHSVDDLDFLILVRTVFVRIVRRHKGCEDQLAGGS